MAFEALLGEKRQDVLRIAGNYGARRVRVFGSVARGEADAESDVDFLVEFDPGRSLLDLGGLQFAAGGTARPACRCGDRARPEGADSGTGATGGSALLSELKKRI